MSTFKMFRAAAAFGLLVASSASQAQVTTTSEGLPVRLAIEAALEAVDVCAAKGYYVTATVVDNAGTAAVVIRGDRATIHTKDTSYRKAYTIVTMGPIFHITQTSQFLELLSKYNPLAGASLGNTPNVTPLPGGVALLSHKEIIAGLGVGGAPGAENDEICARAGAAKIQGKLPQ